MIIASLKFFLFGGKVVILHHWTNRTIMCLYSWFYVSLMICLISNTYEMLLLLGIWRVQVGHECLVILHQSMIINVPLRERWHGTRRKICHSFIMTAFRLLLFFKCCFPALGSSLFCGISQCGSGGNSPWPFSPNASHGRRETSLRFYLGS